MTYCRIETIGNMTELSNSVIKSHRLHAYRYYTSKFLYRFSTVSYFENFYFIKFSCIPCKYFGSNKKERSLLRFKSTLNYI